MKLIKPPTVKSHISSELTRFEPIYDFPFKYRSKIDINLFAWDEKRPINKNKFNPVYDTLLKYYLLQYNTAQDIKHIIYELIKFDTLKEYCPVLTKSNFIYDKFSSIYFEKSYVNVYEKSYKFANADILKHLKIPEHLNYPHFIDCSLGFVLNLNGDLTREEASYVEKEFKTLLLNKYIMPEFQTIILNL